MAHETGLEPVSTASGAIASQPSVEGSHFAFTIFATDEQRGLATSSITPGGADCKNVR